MAEQEFERFVIMPQSILENKDLNTTEKLLLARYSGFKGGIIFESPNMTSKNIGVCLRTLKRARTHLEELGYIKCVEDHGRGKKYMVCNSCTSGVQELHTENKKENTVIPKGITVAQQPTAASRAPRKKSEFNLLIEKLCFILSLDVSKLNWVAVRKWYNEGKASNCTDDDFIKAATAMAESDGNFTKGIHAVLTNTSLWLSRYNESHHENQKGVW